MRAKPGATAWLVTPRGNLVAVPIASWTVKRGIATPVFDVDAPRGAWLFGYQVREGGDIRAFNDLAADSWRIIDETRLRSAFGRLASWEVEAIERAERFIAADRLKELADA